MNQQRGPGWLLIMIETMMAEWGYTLERAVFSGSVTALMTLWPAYLHRNGCEAHGTSADKARQKAKAEKRAELEARFRIVPTGTKEMADFLRRT